MSDISQWISPCEVAERVQRSADRVAFLLAAYFPEDSRDDLSILWKEPCSPMAIEARDVPQESMCWTCCSIESELEELRRLLFEVEIAKPDHWTGPDISCDLPVSLTLIKGVIAFLEQREAFARVGFDVVRGLGLILKDVHGQLLVMLSLFAETKGLKAA